MGEHGGTKYSDIVVKDGNIMIKNLYARPEEITKKLAASTCPSSRDWSTARTSRSTCRGCTSRAASSR